jgi:chromosome segregation ATPase
MRWIAMGLLWSTLAFGQNADPTVQALLKEVHELRVTLERSTMIGPRIQIVVERMKIQQGVVSALAKQADDAKQQFEQGVNVFNPMAGRVREIETQLLSQTDAAARKGLEGELKELKGHMERLQSMESSARARIADLESRTRIEQANLDVLNDKLNQIEKALDRH